MKNFFLPRVFIIIIVCGYVFAQEDKVVAEVGDYKIFESEFKDRFDFSAKPKLLNNSDKEEAKREFLKQLIAEKLLSLEAREKGFNTSDSFRDLISPLENMFIRDALYSQEIKNKVVISDDDIKEGIERIGKVLNIKFLYSLHSEELQQLYSKIKSGASFDSLISLRPELSQNPKEITFGTMDKEVEDVVYTLKPGEFTSPLGAKDGYYILSLVDVKDNAALKDRETAFEEVRKIVRTREEYRTYLSYYHSFFEDKKATADKEMFEDLIKVLIPKFEKKYSPGSVSEKYFLRGEEVLIGFEKFNPEAVFITMYNPIRFKNFLNQLSQDGLYVRYPDERSIRSSLSSYIRKFIEDQLLAEEGKRRGLNSAKDVQNSIRMWEDSYLSKFITSAISDSVHVTEEEAFSIYKQNEWKDAQQMVNIVEIFTDNLDTVELVLNELSMGKDIKQLAREYTKRDSLKNKGGEFGYFPARMHGELGKIASQMKVGEVYGPLQIEWGYSIFQLIGKKENENLRDKSFDEVKDDIYAYLKLQKYQQKIDSFNADLAEKYGVRIHDDVLQGIDNIFLNLVVVRYMGFGGEIFAVPYTEQYSGWYDLWQKNKRLTP